jgi:phosphomannomutase
MTDTMRSRLDHEPVPLKFGTSGRRGAVRHLTQLEVYINARAELEYLQSLPHADGGIRRGDEFFFAHDLRPSSTEFVPSEDGRGEIAQAVERTIRDSGMAPVNAGCIPTPALTHHALKQQCGSIMVTGSHIPFDLNGYKTNSAKGELRKSDEAGINRLVDKVREEVYNTPAALSAFNEQGRFKSGHSELSRENGDARDSYLRRYLDFFRDQTLEGKRILVYQHSAVGRDLLVELLRRFGADVIPAGRSESFVPIDTENIDAAQLARIQELSEAAWLEHGAIDAIVSTDGDSDRPLVLGIEPVASSKKSAPGRVRFFGGDLVGMIVAEQLHADAVVVPITCNDAIDRGAIREMLEPKTRIGSPYVVAGFDAALAKGRKRVCGWEPNGGFLLGSDIVEGDRVLSALPTRDAVLPILEVLFAAVKQKLSVTELFEKLPRRFGRAALIRNFSRTTGRKLIESFSPTSRDVSEIRIENDGLALFDSSGARMPSTGDEPEGMIAPRLAKIFDREFGFGEIVRLNYVDGVRIYFSNGDVAHFRPSGNADELRIYALADTQERANAIAEAGIREPDGLLRKLAASILLKRENT